MGLTPFPHGISSFGVPVIPGYGGLSFTGNVYWVDSGNSSASDNTSSGSFDMPFRTIDYAVGRCTASNGDVIFVKEGHVETVIGAGGLDLDVAGITIVFLGEGANKAYVTFTTDVSADMDIDAASITLVNPKFVAGIDALTGPIDVNAADFKIINGEYHDGTAIDTTDCIVATSAAVRLKIHGWKYYKGTEAGTEKESHIQLNGVDDAELFDIDIFGAFNAGNIECDTDEWLNMRMKNITLVNTDTDPSPCIVGDANMTGVAENVKCRVASGTTFVSNVGKMSWGADCEGFSTDGYAGEPIGTALATGLEGKIDVIDGYHDVPTADAATNTTMRDVVGNKTDAAVGTGTTTKTLMAYTKGILEDTGTTLPALYTVPTADATTNTNERDVIGNKTDAAVGAVTTTKSLMGYLKGVLNAVTAGTLSVQERVALSATAVMVNGDTIFTVAGGPIEIVGLWSECVTANDGTASTLQYSVTHATLGDVTISGASGSLASVAAGSHVTLQSTALNTAALLSTEGATIHATGPSKILMQPGAIKVVIGVGSTTGTWKHYLRYKPMAVGVTVV